MSLHVCFSAITAFLSEKKTTGIAVQDALDKHFSRKTMNGTLRKN